MKLTRFFFLATIFTVTFEKIHWDVAGQIYLADICAIGFIVSFTADRLARGDDRVPRTSIVTTGFLVAFLVVYLVGYFGLDTAVAATQYGKGMTKFAIHFLFLDHGRRLPRPCEPDVLLADGRLLHRRHGRQLDLRAAAADARALGVEPRPGDPLADHRRREQHQHLRRGRGRERLPAERDHRRSEPPRRHAASSRCSRSRPSTCASSLATGGRRRSPSRSASCSSSS